MWQLTRWLTPASSVATCTARARFREGGENNLALLFSAECV
jgi:hypothetical protein